MKFNKILSAVLFLFSFQITTAQEIILPDFSEENLKHHLSILASDSLMGRGFGAVNSGLEMAAEYLKNFAEKTGLNAPVENYIQHFEMFSSQVNDAGSFLTVNDFNGKKLDKIKNIVVLNQQADSFDVNAEIVFAGFGWNDDQTGYNDLQNTNIEGKVVIFTSGTPESFIKNKPDKWESQVERKKILEISEKGAAAVIVVTNIKDRKNSRYNQIEQRAKRPAYYWDKKDENHKIPTIVITPEMAGSIIGTAKKWEKLISGISKSGKPHSFDIKNRKVHIQSVRKTEKIQSQNVIGVVPGSDPFLKNECVVFMAHYDHLGTGENGEIFNGANDNASGVTTLLELARVFSKLREKPKRSVVFLWLSAEEVGLFGSEYYSKNPVFPLNNTSACINLDMVGRVWEPRDSVWNHSPKKVKDFDGVYALLNKFDPSLEKITDSFFDKLGLQPDYSLPESFFNSSDHHHFHQNKVPVLNLSTGYSADYHKETDEIGRIRFDKIKRVAELCFLIGFEMANQ